MTTNQKPLSERIEAEMRWIPPAVKVGADPAFAALLPILREAAELAKRVESARVINIEDMGSIRDVAATLGYYDGQNIAIVPVEGES